MSETPLQPLRIPPDWRVGWNTLFELDPTAENVRRGFFGGSSLFGASSVHMRLAVDVEWRPEDDPDGRYCLTVYYAPWKRTENGRRRKNVALDFSHANVVYDMETRSRQEIVEQIEEVLRGRDEWIEHN
ncbi:hypothetical protein [Rubripirellula tenax]|uniref:hypothetical protein n=1 Tax=Rubripirellula tenax TaxID=2528015 RepID=UPI0011B73D04|nr:hypothetical protein [Rubripirellula tenax]